MIPTVLSADAPRRVLVLGANGRLGRAATLAFAGSGWRVLAQVRRAPETPWPANVQPLVLPFDTADHAQAVLEAARLAGGADTLVYALNPSRYTRAAWRAQALPMLRRAMAVAQGLNARFVLPGNVYAYGSAMPEVLCEDTPVCPDTEMGQIRQAMEVELAAAARRRELSAVVLRAGNFFGAGRGSWLDLVMLTQLQRGRLVYPGPLDVPVAWAYLPDLAQALVAVAQAWGPRAGFDTLHFQGHTLSGRDWLAGLDAMSGRTPLRASSLPWGLMRLAGVFKPEWAALAEGRYLWERPHRLEPTALQRRIGREPHTPFAQALAQSLTDLGWTAPTAAGAVPPAPLSA